MALQTVPAVSNIAPDCWVPMQYRGRTVMGRFGLYGSPDVDIATDVHGLPSIRSAIPGKPIRFAMNLHGWGGGHNTYGNALEKIAESLSDYCRFEVPRRAHNEVPSWVVVSPVSPGFCGTKLLLPDERSYGAHAEWLESLVRGLEMHRVIQGDATFDVVGHSMGAGHAVQFAHDFDRVRSLTLLNGVPGFKVADWTHPEKLLAVADFLAHLPNVARHGAPNMVQSLTGSGFLPHRPFKYYFHMMRDDQQLTQMQTLADRGMKPLVITSSFDWIVSKKAASVQAEIFDVKLVTARGCHTWFLENDQSARYLSKLVSLHIDNADHDRRVSLMPVQPVEPSFPPKLSIVPETA